MELNRTTPSTNIITIAACEVEHFEQTNIHNGFLVTPFPDDQGDQTHDGENDQCGNELRAEPVVFLSFVERNLKGAYAEGEQDKPNVVEPRQCAFQTGQVGRIFDKLERPAREPEFPPGR